VVVGYRGDDIVAYYGDDFRGVPLTYAWQDDRLGLGHAVLTAEAHVDGDVVVWNGDNVGDVALAGLIERHRTTDAVATLLVDDVSRERASEGAVFVLKDDEPVGVVEKPDDPPSTLVPRGVFAFSERVFDALARIEPSDRGEYELADAVDRLFDEESPVELIRQTGWLTNVNTVDDVERVDRRIETDDGDA
jgi:dTDP-glucose pyrophosphorylase